MKLKGFGAWLKHKAKQSLKQSEMCEKAGNEKMVNFHQGRFSSFKEVIYALEKWDKEDK